MCSTVAGVSTTLARGDHVHDVANDTIGENQLNLGSTSGSQVDSTSIPADSGYTATNYTASGFLNPDSALSITSHLNGINTKLGLISAGLIIKDNTWLGGTLFNNTDGVRQNQAIYFVSNPSDGDTFVIKSTAGTETWTFKDTPVGAYDVQRDGSDYNVSLVNLYTKINSASTAVSAEWDIVDDLHATDKILLLRALDANTDHRTYASFTGTRPSYSMNAQDTYTELCTHARFVPTCLR